MRDSVNHQAVLVTHQRRPPKISLECPKGVGALHTILRSSEHAVFKGEYFIPPGTNSNLSTALTESDTARFLQRKPRLTRPAKGLLGVARAQNLENFLTCERN